MKMNKKILYEIRYWTIIGLIGLIRKIPYRIGAVIGSSLGALAWAVDPLHRKIVNVQMRAALGDAYHWSLSLRVFMNIGKIPVDTIKCLYMNEAELWSKFKIEGMENTRDALSSGRGVMVIVAHMGNWETLMHMARFLKVECHIMMDIRNEPRLESIIKDMRSRLPGIIIEPPKGGMVSKLSQELKKGHLVAIIVDQRGRQGIMLFCDVLGMPAPTSPAPALIAIKGDALIVPVYALTEGDTYKVIFEKPVDSRLFGTAEDVPDKLSDCCKSEPIQRLSDYMQSWVSSIVRANPTQWSWLYSRWTRRSEMRRIIRRGRYFKAHISSEAQRLGWEAPHASAEGS